MLGMKTPAMLSALRRLRRGLVALAVVGALAPAAGVLAGEARADPVVLLAQMAPDQRRQMRQEMRDHWRQSPNEDRQRMRDPGRGYWQPMPPEDRQRMRDEMRARRGDGHGYGPPPGGPPGGGYGGHRGGGRR